ncbi:NAD(P)/FAD-dependent oxidoreductase [Lacticaseibacillus paracasei]|uniref:NAD(P)/FAD-dependent oxidoreductase n=1 Tax=Lacticaseibacillus paracasei TaxID=1597 RepID=UPI003391C505
MNQITIIGAGAAGIGMGVALKQLGCQAFQILERGEIGESFQNWPVETRFITPSFTSNGFGMPDLNAVSMETSPAYTIGAEHLSGPQFAKYLRLVAKTYDLPISKQTRVVDILPNTNGYTVVTDHETIATKYLIMAVGQYTFPKLTDHPENVIHYSQVHSWQDLSGKMQVIVGGNESGVDAAIHLAQLGHKILMVTKSTGLNAAAADPSIRLAPYTRRRFLDLPKTTADNITLQENISLQSVIQHDRQYHLLFADGRSITIPDKPIVCTGFSSGPLALWPQLFDSDDGDVILSDVDESTVAKNVFVVGPDVRHQDAIFCYIYKFRQRFGVIINEIARREGWNIGNFVAANRANSFFLDDCDTCDVTCDC